MCLRPSWEDFRSLALIILVYFLYFLFCIPKSCSSRQSGPLRMKCLQSFSVLLPIPTASPGAPLPLARSDVRRLAKLGSPRGWLCSGVGMPVPRQGHSLVCDRLNLLFFCTSTRRQIEARPTRPPYNSPSHQKNHVTDQQWRWKPSRSENYIGLTQESRCGRVFCLFFFCFVFCLCH